VRRLQSEVISERASSGAVASAGELASGNASVPASGGTTLTATSGHPLGSHVQVNSVALVHESGSEAQAPLAPLKHHPQPSTGVHEPHVVYALHMAA